MTPKYTLIMLLGMAAATPVFSDTNPPPPEAVAVRIETPPALDGSLADPCWQTIKPLGDFFIEKGNGKTTTDTEVKIAYDDTWLYFGILCRHPCPKHIENQGMKYKDPVHRDDAIELFLDPGTGGKTYFNFRLNSANIKDEVFLTDGGAGGSHVCSIPWRSATSLVPEGWTAEIAVPLYLFATYGEMEAMRMNVIRNKVAPVLDQQNMKVGEIREKSAWSPLRSTPHYADNQAPLKGLRDVKVKLPFLASFSDEQISSYYAKDGGFCYDATLKVQRHNAVPGTVRVAVEDLPAVGAAMKTNLLVDLTQTNSVSATVSVPVKSLGLRKVRLALEDAATGETLNQTYITDLSQLNPMDAYLERTFYTTEDHANAIMDCAIPSAMLEQTRVVIKDSRDKIVAEQQKVATHSKIAITLKDWPDGKHPLKLALLDREGATILSQEMELIKRPPKPGREWKIDRERRILLNNGEPFFPIGMLLAYVYMNPHTEVVFKLMSEAGFNTVFKWERMTVAEGKAWLDLAAKYNLRVIDFIDDGYIPLGYKHPKYGQVRGATHMKGLLVGDTATGTLQKSAWFHDYISTNMPVMENAVDTMKDHPNLMMWYVFDEPFGRAYFDQVDEGMRIYKMIHQRDGYHPSMSWWFQEKDGGWFDVTGFDPYWDPAQFGVGGLYGTVNRVSKETAITSRYGKRFHMPNFMTPLMEYVSGTIKRPMLPQEQLCQTYMILIHGGRAVLWFRYPFSHWNTWNGMKTAVQHLKTLSPLMFTPDIPQEIAYSPGRFDPDKEVFPDVQVALRQFPDGGYVLLAANSRTWPVSVRYTLRGLGKSGKVGRLLDDARYDIKDDSFSDRLEPYGVRAYRLKSLKSPEIPAAIAVNMTAQTNETVKESFMTGNMARAGKNVLCNPSFEEALLPGWPDYYKPWVYGKIDQDSWGQVANGSVHGAHCVMLNNVAPDVGCRGLYTERSPQVKQPTLFVFSVYLKAEKDGMKVRLVAGGKNKIFDITKEWQRYFITGEVPPGLGYHGLLMGIQLFAPGRIWTDAWQLELNVKEPTEFEP